MLLVIYGFVNNFQTFVYEGFLSRTSIVLQVLLYLHDGFFNFKY